MRWGCLISGTVAWGQRWSVQGPPDRMFLGPRLAAQVPWPFYFIGTRDSFAHHLIPVE